MEKDAKRAVGRGWGEWLALVAGWLACAGACLGLSILLESYPAAYDTFFPFIILLLFGNIFIFFFIASRWSGNPGRLYNAVLRIFLGEALILAGIFLLGKYAFG